MKKNASIYLMMLALIFLSVLLMKDSFFIHTGKAFYIDTFRAGTNILLFSVLKIMLVFTALFFIFSKEK